jgi:hypothetical protein
MATAEAWRACAEGVRLMPVSAYYTLSEPAGSTVAADSSGNQWPMLTQARNGTAVAFGTDIGLAGSPALTAAGFSGGKYLTGLVASTTTPSLFIVFNLAAPPAAVVFLAILRDDVISQNFNLQIDTSGNLTGFVRGNSGSSHGVTSGVVTDGHNHVAEVTLDGSDNLTLYLDGASVGTTGVTSGLSALGRLSVGNDGNSTTLTGTLAHVAVYGTATSAARALSKATGALTAFAGESGTDRITRIAGYAGLPIGTLDPSLTNMPPA